MAITAVAAAVLAPAIGAIVLAGVGVATATTSIDASDVFWVALAYYVLALVWFGPLAGCAVYASLSGVSALRDRVSPTVLGTLLVVGGALLGLACGYYFVSDGPPLPHGGPWSHPRGFVMGGLTSGAVWGLICALVHARTTSNVQAAASVD